MASESNSNKSRGSKSVQAAGRSKNPASHTARGAAVDKEAQRKGGQHSHGGR